MKPQPFKELLIEKVGEEYRVIVTHDEFGTSRETFTGDTEAAAIGLYICRRTVPNVELLGQLVLENAASLGLKIKRGVRQPAAHATEGV